MDETLDFIQRRFSKDCHWLDGNCYYFAVILCTRFPHLSLYYAPIAGHFVAGHDGEFYDWRGRYEDEIPILFDEIKESDHAWYARIVRDCIS